MTVNLCFHGIGRCEREREPGESHYWVADPVFHGILDLVAGRPDVVLSFDDGNRSDADIALPALKERDLTAAFFVLAGRLDDPASLSPADVVELKAQGMTIGSHGWAHIPWRGLSPADTRRELHDARAAIADIVGEDVDEAAFPLGLYDRHVLRDLRGAGYRRVYTSDRFPAKSSEWLQARFSVTAADTVDSVRGILSGQGILRETRNRLAAAVKRIR